MKYFISALVVTILLLSAGCATEEPAPPPKIVEDLAKEVPELAKSLFENDYIRVTLVELASRQGLPKHHALDRVVYSLDRYRLRTEPVNGVPEMKEFSAGECYWHPEGVLTATNAAVLTAKYLIVERKKPYPEPEKPSNLVAIARGYAANILNNEDIRVLELGVVAKASIPNHDSSGRLIYAIQPMKFRFTEGKETVVKEFQEGDVHWQEAGRHRAQNITGEPVGFLIFEFKK